MRERFWVLTIIGNEEKATELEMLEEIPAGYYGGDWIVIRALSVGDAMDEIGRWKCGRTVCGLVCETEARRLMDAAMEAA